MDQWTSFIATIIAHTTGAQREWLLAVTLFVGMIIAFFIARFILVTHLTKIARKTRGHWDDMIVKIVESIRPSLYYSVAFFVAIQTVQMPAILRMVILVLFALVVTYYVAYVIGIVAQHLAQHVAANGKQQEYDARGAISLMASIFKLLVWVGSALFVISNFGVDITSLIAGLGIGGIAVAFAIQGILKDLFSSFSLFFDQPFATGDFIEVGDQSGTVQKIGIKTTRLKALSGEEVIVPNQDLTSLHVRNFKRMERRRVAQKIGVVYETPQEKLAQIPAIIEEVIAGVDGITFGRAHFYAFDDWALSFEIVYFVQSRDYRTYMDAREAINFGILRAFGERGIEMAYPTQMVYHRTKE